MLLGSSQCIFLKSGKKLNCINFLENFDSMSGIRNFLHDNTGIYAWQHVNYTSVSGLKYGNYYKHINP